MKRRIRTKAALPLVVVAAALAVTSTAAAQQDTDAVERCRALPTDSERFACLEGYVLGRGSVQDAEAPAVPTPSVSVVAPVEAAATSTTAAASSSRNDDTERRGMLRSLRVPFLGGSNDDRAPVVTEADAPGRDSLGDAQVAARSEVRVRESEQRFAYMIVEVDESFFGGLEVTLDNGQVWRQQRDDGQRVLLDEGDPMGVEIWQSDRFRGYRMRLVEQQRTLRVQRVR